MKFFCFAHVGQRCTMPRNLALSTPHFDGRGPIRTLIALASHDQ